MKYIKLYENYNIDNVLKELLDVSDSYEIFLEKIEDNNYIEKEGGTQHTRQHGRKVYNSSSYS